MQLIAILHFFGNFFWFLDKNQSNTELMNVEKNLNSTIYQNIKFATIVWVQQQTVNKLLKVSLNTALRQIKNSQK